MKTIIPNKLSFDLDLNDLPARATRVSPEAIILSAAGVTYIPSLELRANGGKGPRTRTTQFSSSQAKKACKNSCRKLNRGENGCAVKAGGKSGNRYWNCICTGGSKLSNPECF